MRDTFRCPRRAFGRWVLCVLAAVIVWPVVGCGPSQEDLIMRAANRRRPKDPSEEEEPKRPTPPSEVAVVSRTAPAPAPTVAGATPSIPVAAAPTQTPTADGPPATDGPPASSTAAVAGMQPISQRKANQPQTEVERRARSVENLTKLSQALQSYYEQNKRYPQTFISAGNRVPTLSWRVELLPYLGHQQLFDKFDRSKPWNMEPNRSLLDFIPDEFVSPERYDTSTNYLMPAASEFMFGKQRSPRLNQIEDGPDATIMLLEVNDSLAVPWTQPSDYVPRSSDAIVEDIRGLRSDGTFAVWANGWLVLLANRLSGKQLYSAMTYESGDGPQAARVHQQIEVAVEGASAGRPSTQTASNATVALPTSNPVASRPHRDVSEPRRGSAGRGSQATIVREPVPRTTAVKEAQRKLRKIYATRIADAKEDNEKVALARDMLADAAEMVTDGPGTYALQTAAFRLALLGGDVGAVISILDQRVARFEVDPYDENVKWLLECGKSTANREPKEVKSADFFRRTVSVIHKAVRENDFNRAGQLARIAIRLSEAGADEERLKLLQSLRASLAVAKKEYDGAVLHLATYRSDSSNQKAGAALGRFLCFFKGDWEMGLPLLVHDESSQISELAQLDLQGASDPMDQTEIGDAWWALSERARGSSYRAASRNRAAYWYEQALQTMPNSLDRMHVKSRLDDYNETDASSPLALCDLLADEGGVDLTVGLVDLARDSRSSRSRRDDD